MSMKAALRSAMESFGVAPMRIERVKQLEAMEQEAAGLLGLVAKALHLDDESKSQLGQDIFVLLETSFKRDGFFVEFGATDGVEHSNTYLLEKKFGWNGILAEPAPVWHANLRQNRNVYLDFDCVWTETGKNLEFTTVRDATLSTISTFRGHDHHAEERRKGTTQEVRTVSLADLLKRHNAPRAIDYLSIDTEGSEFDILNSFDFGAYDISLITCEHNYTKDRERVFQLLSANGYERNFASLSKWDDWYVRRKATGLSGRR